MKKIIGQNPRKDIYRNYITTCNNDPNTKCPPGKHPFKKPFRGTKNIRTHPINIPVTTELKIYYPLAGQKTQPPNVQTNSPFRICIELTDLAIARSASHQSHRFVASDARRALHTQCCIPDPTSFGTFSGGAMLL